MKVSVYSATRAEAVEELTATRPSRPEIQKEAVNWWVSCFWVCQALAVPEECLPTTGQIWITCGSSEMLYIFFFPQSYLKSNLHLNVRVVGLGIYFQWLTIWRKLHSLPPHFRRNIFFFQRGRITSQSIEEFPLSNLLRAPSHRLFAIRTVSLCHRSTVQSFDPIHLALALSYERNHKIVA